MKTKSPDGYAVKFSVSLPHKVAVWLRERAAVTHGGVSAVVRVLLEQAMNREAGAAAPTRLDSAASRRAGRIAAEKKRNRPAA